MVREEWGGGLPDEDERVVGPHAARRGDEVVRVLDDAHVFLGVERVEELGFGRVRLEVDVLDELPVRAVDRDRGGLHELGLAVLRRGGQEVLGARCRWSGRYLPRRGTRECRVDCRSRFGARASRAVCRGTPRA